MKNRILYLLCLFILTACNPQYKVIKQKYNYSESITFTVDKIKEWQSIATGDNYAALIEPKFGKKFVLVFLTIKNEKGQRQEINYENIYLLDQKTNIKYKVDKVMKISFINSNLKHVSNIGSFGTKRRKIIFQFPEDKKAQYLQINERVLEIKFQK